LSAIHGNLPAELRACAAKPSTEKDESSSGSGVSTPIPELSKQDLKKMMDDIPCVGEIPRSGKDAAGKPLENEFYYVPEMDTDPGRRDIVTSGMRGTGLRAVRKQHKVCTALSRDIGALADPDCSNTTGSDPESSSRLCSLVAVCNMCRRA
jgi:hypothetical protein